ncbi:MAG: N-6 DNA methylase [Phycisphaeraceae bacterium]|nr:N-6 DNA methylase [Phycisphaeraceae bacterium]
MAKRPSHAIPDSRLFEQHERITTRRIRRQRALFIPKFVREVADRLDLAGDAQDRAHRILCHWADLESQGRLSAERETSIDTQFLDQVFGEALGYAVKTKSPTDWQLEHKITVTGVGIADGALGEFPASKSPAVIIELKGARTDIDRDRSNGRTAVQQCWDYLNALPDCQWGIVSNFSTIRLYHKSRGTLNYEEFSLDELRERKRFNEFYAIFERGGLLTSILGQPPRADALLERTKNRQKEVGDELYQKYQRQRLELIDHLVREESKPLDEAIRIAQKILDRIIFIAFCEDRGLLPEDSLKETNRDVRRYSRARNPAWESFLDLFTAIDRGAKGKKEITAYNGGLFADDPAINTLDMEGDEWTTGFAGFGEFDFSEEVNVDVLGHLFERSITELEKLRVGGLFALKANIQGANGSHGTNAKKARPTRRRKANSPPPPSDDSPLSRMPKSAQRKRFGIYYTPPAFTSLIVERTVDAIVEDRFAALAKQHSVDPQARKDQNPKKLLAYWLACLEELKTITVCDPACGSGAFLIRAYDALDAHYKAIAHGLGGSGHDPEALKALEDSIPDLILKHNLYGVDLSHEAVEITQLALWIRTARLGRPLTDLSRHIRHGNSLVSDPAVDPRAFDWHKAFPSVFGGSSPGGSALQSGVSSADTKSPCGFTCIIGNPPWERVKVQDREFFSLTDPETAEAVNASDRKKRIAAMPEDNPDLHDKYIEARDRAQKMLDYARLPEKAGGRYPFTGKGDVNLYMLFAELARSLVAPRGVVGLLVPSGIATDDTTKEFFADLMDTKRLVSLYDFENKEAHFEDVHRSFKFTALVFGGNQYTQPNADFVFFARDVDETAASNKHRHIPLTAADMKLLNPNTRTCPIFRTRRDAELTKAIYKRVPILIDENRKQGGNPWGVKFYTMFHQTNDAEHFKEAKVWEKKGYKLHGNVYTKTKARALPLYEAKMVQAFDHRAASVIVEDSNWVRQGQKAETSLVEHQNPEFAVLPRWWVAEDVVDDALQDQPGDRGWFMGFKDITSPTNERTMIASFSPRTAATNKFVLMLTGVEPRLHACLLANFNSFAFDYVTRQKIGGITLNFFIVEQLPAFAPDTYADKCPWSKRETLEHWISERVLKLSCTAEDMIPLANACHFKGSRGDGVHIWKEQERAHLRAELDAAYFHLYAIEREDAEYMLSTFTHTGFIPKEHRQPGGPAWERASIGEQVLESYDALAAGFN